MAPAIVTRKVTKTALRATMPGPLGVSQRYTFSAHWLVAEERRELTLHFDPLDAWPLHAMVSDPRTGKFLGMADCANPVSMGGIDEDSSKHIRQIMRTEYHTMTASGKAATDHRIRSYPLAPLKRAADRDSSLVLPAAPTPATPTDYAAMRQLQQRAGSRPGGPSNRHHHRRPSAHRGRWHRAAESYPDCFRRRCGRADCAR